MIVGLVVLVVLVVLLVFLLAKSIKIVQQGSVGVVKRLGKFTGVRQPGLHLIVPIVDQMVKVDMREFPQIGDTQAVITKDNVQLRVSATVFCQVVDVKSALFEINDHQLAIDQLAVTALRAVFGEMTLDESLSNREAINRRMQDHMADATMKWGVRLNRIEILDMTPPDNILRAMSEQKEAEQHKRAAILQSEGEQQSAINRAQGRKQSAVLEAEGDKQSAILGAEGQMKVLELRAEGERIAQTLRGAGEAAELRAIDEVAINPHTLAVLQLQALRAVASAPNSKVVVPYSAAGLVGTAEVLVDALKGVLSPDGVTPPAPSANGRPSPSGGFEPSGEPQPSGAPSAAQRAGSPPARPPSQRASGPRSAPTRLGA